MLHRRRLLGGLLASGVATAGLCPPRAEAADPPPETTRLRLVRIPAVCMAPQVVAEDLLRGEGFTDVAYVPAPDLATVERLLATGEIDLAINYGGRIVIRLEAGDPIVTLTGIHTGCVEIIGGPRVRSMADLRGKRIAAGRVAAGVPGFLEMILGQLGLRAGRDYELLNPPAPEGIEMFARGEVDAFTGIPPEPQELRSRGFGRVVLDSGRDRPWSQYFCCMVAAGRSFHDRHPAAAKRAVRALLKGADRCSAEPERSARLLLDRGVTVKYEWARDTFRELSRQYRAWRDYDPEEALRFYALRLREVGQIKANPKELIARGADWRIIRELRKELRA